MARRLLRRYLPAPDTLRAHRSLRFLGPLLAHHRLWQLNRHSVARAVGIGLFAALLPIPMQMLLAAALAVPALAHLPIAVSLVWLTNPLTLPAVFYCTYRLGAWLLGLPPRQWPEGLDWAWISEQLATMWQPFLLGSATAATAVGLAGYFATLGAWGGWVRWQWRKRRVPTARGQGSGTHATATDQQPGTEHIQHHGGHEHEGHSRSNGDIRHPENAVAERIDHVQDRVGQRDRLPDRR